MNPMPNAAPISPKFFARFSGGLTSAMYADAGPNVAPAIPAIVRPKNNQPSVGAIPMIK